MTALTYRIVGAAQRSATVRIDTPWGRAVATVLNCDTPRLAAEALAMAVTAHHWPIRAEVPRGGESFWPEIDGARIRGCWDARLVLHYEGEMDPCVLLHDIEISLMDVAGMGVLPGELAQWTTFPASGVRLVAPRRETD